MGTLKALFSGHAAGSSRHTKLRSLILCTAASGVDTATYGCPRRPSTAPSVKAPQPVLTPEGELDSSFYAHSAAQLSPVAKPEGLHMATDYEGCSMTSKTYPVDVLDCNRSLHCAPNLEGPLETSDHLFPLPIRGKDDKPTTTAVSLAMSRTKAGNSDCTTHFSGMIPFETVSAVGSVPGDLAGVAAEKWHLLGIHPDATRGRIELEDDGSPVLEQYFEKR